MKTIKEGFLRFVIALVMLLSFDFAYAIPVTITATNLSTAPATDFHIPTDGDGEDEFVNFNSSQITSDYDVSIIQTTQNVTHAVIGKDGTFQNFITGATADDEICFFFLNDPVMPGEEFIVVFDVTFLDGTEVDAESLTGLNGDVYFSYADGSVISVAQGHHDSFLGRPVDSIVLNKLNSERLRVDLVTDQFTVFSAVPEPSIISLLLLGFLVFCFRGHVLTRSGLAITSGPTKHSTGAPFGALLSSSSLSPRPVSFLDFNHLLRRKTMNIRTMIVLIFAYFGSANFAQAGSYGLFEGHSAGCGQGGITFERALRPSTFTVFLTDCSRNVIGNIPFTTVTGTNVRIAIPGKFGGTKVGDVKNITKLNRSPGETAELDIESLVLDTNQIVIEGIFDRLALEVGYGVEVHILDLYADTNGDGELNDPDYLYSLVDMHQFLQAIPVFSLGDSYNIVNGQVDVLPGMLFSTTPFIFNPLATTGFDFTPFSGNGVAESEHVLSAVPEPSTLLLFAIGCLGLFRRRFQVS